MLDFNVKTNYTAEELREMGKSYLITMGCLIATGLILSFGLAPYLR